MNPEYMKAAIDIAKKSLDDVPVGAVIVKNGEIISSAVNEREKLQCTTAHAEILAVQRANERIGSKRLNGCEIYVTLEPCPMCASAILQSGILKVYFGAYDVVNGAFGSKCDMCRIMNITAEVKGGISEDDCSKLLKEFFKNVRIND